MNETFDSSFIHSIITGEFFILALSVLAFGIGTFINNRVRRAFTAPILIAVIIVSAVLLLLDIDYETYAEKSHLITFLLNPTVVALGYALYKQSHHLKGNILTILSIVAIGAVVGVVSVFGFCRLTNVSDLITASMQPKSVTMPIALVLSERSGGLPALTAVSVMICGIFGSIIGPWFLNKIGVKSKVAKGLALGTASHGIGTARAMQLGQLEGAIAGMAIGLMGIMTAIAIPLTEYFFTK